MEYPEFNDLTTDNTATSFDPSPDNIATSDETEAAPVYAEETVTQYAKAKRVAAAVTTTIAVVSVGVGGVSLFNTTVVDTPPTISEESTFVVSDTEDSFTYDFTVTNDKQYTMSFDIYIETEVKFTLDVTEAREYSGTVTGLGYNKEGYYEITYIVNDTSNSLVKELFNTPLEA